ncbi:7850_t:CDS:2 [Funneliformis caledonium]|uniref:mRNA export factor GLE1 n=1 Tax=Funneliformis caledonium TaxID=1117310 RepID=A0A9N8WB93_9GLOM|nr:7850_t:CDS:2 [Funneliformis caledonium]
MKKSIVTQEDLDFVACESDRFESERIRWKNKLIQQAVAQTEAEYENEISIVKEEERKKLKEAERKRNEKYERLKKFYDELALQYERERRKREQEFQAEQAKWSREAEKYERELQAKKQAELNRKRLEEEQKRKQAQAAAHAQEAALAEEKRLKEKQIKEAEADKRNKETQKIEAEKKALNKLVSDSALKEEEKYRQYLKVINDNIAKNSQLKAQSLESRRAITLALNTLTNDRIKIIDIATRLDKMLKSVQNNKQLYYFLLNFTAKGIVKHAEVDVLSNESAAFPFAHVSVLLSTEHPDFMDKLMMVRLVKKCPYVLPRYYVKLPNQSLNDFRKQMGYKHNEDDEAYVNRMCAILALYCAIMQTVPLIPVFKEQGGKLILVACKAYVQQLPPEIKPLLTTSPAAMSRLRTFLENASQKGFTEPEGSNPR